MWLLEGRARHNYAQRMTTSQRLILVLTLLLLGLILGWVLFLDGPRSLIFSAVGLVGVLLLALLTRAPRRRQQSRDGSGRR